MPESEEGYFASCSVCGWLDFTCEVATGRGIKIACTYCSTPWDGKTTVRGEVANPGDLKALAEIWNEPEDLVSPPEGKA